MRRLGVAAQPPADDRSGFALKTLIGGIIACSTTDAELEACRRVRSQLPRQLTALLYSFRILITILDTFHLFINVAT